MTTKDKSHAPGPIRLSLPATSANLGPAFDAAALAMDFYLHLQARVASTFSLAATGRDREICESLENNLILTTYCEVVKAERRDVLPLAIKIENEIPIGKGCGSSAAARVAGVVLAVHFGNLGWSDTQIIEEASRREQHPDNAAACWMGGLTVARMSPASEVQVASLQPKGNWPLLLAVPQQSLATAEARRALPEKYSRADAVLNIQNSMLLLAAFTEGRPDLLAAALEDRIHEPYRAPLCPLLPCLQLLKRCDGVLGSVLSGAGPSVLVFVDPAASLAKARTAVEHRLAESGLSAELLSTSISRNGAGPITRMIMTDVIPI
ncbi:MAG TPA: homoserine kinase [Candidatus Sulfotelmatobacter sp.]|nr:homoserine kinase [Candidatus Sulfotelmatobacter sp.]